SVWGVAVRSFGMHNLRTNQSSQRPVGSTLYGRGNAPFSWDVEMEGRDKPTRPGWELVVSAMAQTVSGGQASVFSGGLESLLEIRFHSRHRRRTDLRGRRVCPAQGRPPAAPGH